MPGVVPKEPGEGRLGSVRTFGGIFLLKMGTRCWRVWPEAPLREAQEGERQSRQPSARTGRKLQLPPPALRLEGDRVPRVALFDHGDPPGLSFVLSGARGGLGTGVFKGLFFPWTSEPPSPAGLTSGRRLAPAPGAAARAVYGHTALFSLVFFLRLWVLLQGFSRPEGAGLRPQQAPSYAENAPLWDTELMSPFPVR